MEKSQVLKKVVITGLGALTPIGNNVIDFCHSLVNGVSGAAPITKFDSSKFKAIFACELKNFDVRSFLKKAKPEDLILIHNMHWWLWKSR